jgi:type VI secretion system secreted protein Hcp
MTKKVDDDRRNILKKVTAAAAGLALASAGVGIVSAADKKGRDSPSTKREAVDMFLKIEGVDGESQDSHKKEIDVLAFSWGMTQSGSMHIGGGGGSVKVSVQDMSITKFLDKSSAELVKRCCSGKHFPRAILTCRKAGDDPVEWLKVTMEEVLVSSVSEGGSGGEDQQTENVTLNFAKVKVEY